MKMILLILFCFLTSCAHTPRVNPQDHLLKIEDLKATSKIYTPEKAKEEIAVLLNFFKYGYSGYNFIESSKIDLAHKRLKRLPNDRNDSWQSLCKSIAEIFNDLPDNHLQAYLDNNCLDKSLLKKRKSDIGGNIALNESNKAYVTSFKNHNGNKIGIIGIKRFPAFDDLKWDGFETDIKKLKMTSKIIIDLRGNSGGDDSRGIQLASYLKGEDIIKGHFAKDYEGTNSQNYILILNKMIAKSNGDHNNPWQRYIEHYQEMLKNPPQEKYTSTFHESYLNTRINEASYNKPIYVLADASCGSSGESTLQALRTLKNVKVVGQNTAGTTHFGNQGLLILPHSRMEISMSTKFIKFNDGKFIEKAGHSPDISVPDGTDALDFALTL